MGKTYKKNIRFKPKFHGKTFVKDQSGKKHKHQKQDDIIDKLITEKIYMENENLD